MADVKKIDGYWIKDASAAADVSINSAGVNIKLRGGSTLLNPINEINVNSATIGDLLVSGGASFTSGATGASGAIVSGDPDYVTGGVVFEALQNAGSGGIDTAVATKATATYLLGQEGTTAKSDSQGPYKYDASVYIQLGGIVTNTVKATTAGNQSKTKLFATNGTIQDLTTLLSDGSAVSTIKTSTAANQSATKYFATNGTIQDIPNLSDQNFVNATVGGSGTSRTITLSTGDPYQLASITGLTSNSTTSVILSANCFPTTNGTAKNIVLVITRAGTGNLDITYPSTTVSGVSIKNFMNTVTSGAISTLTDTKTTLELVFTCGKTAAGTYYCSFNGSDVINGLFESVDHIEFVGRTGLIKGYVAKDSGPDNAYYFNGNNMILGGGENTILIAPGLRILPEGDGDNFSNDGTVELWGTHFNIIGPYDIENDMDCFLKIGKADGISAGFGNYRWEVMTYTGAESLVLGKCDNPEGSDNYWYGIGIVNNGFVVSGSDSTYVINGQSLNGVHTVESFAFKSGASNRWADIYAKAFYQLSDKRIKNIHEEIDLDKAYDLIEKCSTIIYDLKDDPKHKDQIGVIAQEIEEFFPEIVETDENGIKSVNYSRLTVVVMKVLKDVIKRLTSIEEKMK